MNFTLHQLQVFSRIAKVKSITHAAEELHISQPAASIQLKNFQQQFDIPLTEVVGRQLFITDFGMEIAQAADNVLNEVQAIYFKTMAHKGNVSGRLRVSVVSTGKYVMPYFLNDFVKEFSAVDLAMDVTNRDKVLESLKRNEVDFSLVSILPEGIKVEHEEFMKNKLYLVGSPNLKSEGLKKGKANFEQLPLIYREPGSGTRRVMETFLESNNLYIRKKMTLATNEAVKQAVIAGLGYSIMPLIGIKKELDLRELQIIPVKGLPIISIWNLVWRKDKKFSPVAKAYLEFVRQQKEEIIKKQFSWYEAY